MILILMVHFFIQAIWKRPELLKYNHSARDLIGVIDFAVSGLQLPRKKAFALLHGRFAYYLAQVWQEIPWGPKML